MSVFIFGTFSVFFVLAIVKLILVSHVVYFTICKLNSYY